MIAEAQPAGLTTGGWIVMIGCIGFVCTLGAICFWRILAQKPPAEGEEASSDTNRQSGG